MVSRSKCLTSTETIRLTRGGKGGGGGKREIVYLSLHCYHQNDSCIKMGSYERHFNVSLIVKDSHKQDGVLKATHTANYPF